ncbi:MAG: TrbI/VirB10 family protein, partial [Chlorobiaceae bacterium]|nr:TrbI/VirB10 family protein [Chlorobiaceae bacterium]NTV61775.1 TrbI/VirB10 family protein [Chlorobiaceae bacterium]
MAFGRKKRSVPSDGSVGSEGLTDDVHASKIPSDDSRLRLPVTRSRSLKKGPVFAIGAILLCVILGALSLAMWPKDKGKAVRKDDAVLSQLFTVPDKIRKGPGNDAPVMAADPVSAIGENMDKLFAAGTSGQTREPSMAGPGTENDGGNQAQESDDAEEETAIKASPFFGGNGTSPGGAGSVPASLVAALGNSMQQGSSFAYGRGGQNMQDRKNDFFVNGAGEEKEYVPKSMQSPLSKYEIKAGSVIPVLLVTAINSDLPGNVVAMVSEDVYDTRTGDYLLIPKGTRVLGRYDSMVSYGQSRVQVNWNRIVRPDGSSIVLDNMPGVDLAGNSGYKDKVDNHFDRLAGGVILSSLLSVGASVSQGPYTDESSMTLQQRMAANVGQNINDVGSQITRKNLDIQPTIKIL